ncbi:MAG: acyl-CoA thioesterase [Flavobacteriaceae bacterium]|nr:acyl-CoA thioesterase [Flavobacteriaceae bacterium]
MISANSKIPEDKVSLKQSFLVGKNDIDALNHVNNIVYLKWVQDISELHWNTLASKEMIASCVWVALRHEIDYINQAYENDQINCYTWIEKNEGVKSIRIVHIYCNEKLLAKSRTFWCLLDAKTLKPKRITKEILELFIK